jgi:limonene-1,2-epoxide hydrolase
MSVVDDYLSALARHDWPTLRATLSDERLVRIGPFCDRVEGADAYVEFLRKVMPALRGYLLDIKRSSSIEGRTFVELSEHVEVQGRPIEYPECILFEVGQDGKISDVRVFMMTPPEAASGEDTGTVERNAHSARSPRAPAK